jgi:hypothetical protein
MRKAGTPLLRAVPLSLPGARVAADLTPKARSIELLWSLGLSVPPAVALVVDEAIDRTELGRHISELGLLDIVREWGPSLAIRSSAAGEDTLGQTNAGKFESVLDVPVEVEPIVEAIFRVLDSYGGRGSNDCVIVQKYVVPHFGGVLFTQGDDDRLEATIEWTTDQVGVTAGTHGVEHSRIDLQRTHQFPGLPIGASKDLVSAALSLAGQFSNGVDLEWIVDAEARTWLVQARAVTARIETHELRTDFATDIDELNPTELPATSQLAKIVASFNVKRRWARLSARANGIDYARTYVAFAQDEMGLARHWANVRNCIRTPLVTLKQAAVDHPLEHKVVRADDVESVLATMAHSKECEMYVAEYFEPATCGLAGRLEGGGYLVEFVQGDIQALYSGDNFFSSYHVGQDGSVIYSDLVVQSRAYRLDYETGNARLVDISPGRVALAASVVAAIIRMTDVACERFGEARVEWICVGDQVVMFDLSVEGSALPRRASAEVRVVSSGHVEGEALVITEADIAQLNSVIKLHRSVVASSEESAAISEPDVVAVRDQILARVEGAPIVVAQFPDLSLSVFLDSAIGFIFAAGAMLSHLGIIVREEHKPALITPAARDLHTGDRVWIEGDGIRSLSSGSSL